VASLSHRAAILLPRCTYRQTFLCLPLTAWPPAVTPDPRAVLFPLYVLVQSVHSCKCACIEERAHANQLPRPLGRGAQSPGSPVADASGNHRPARRSRRRRQGKKDLAAGPKHLFAPQSGGGEGEEGGGRPGRAAADPRSRSRLPCGGLGRCSGAQRPARAGPAGPSLSTPRRPGRGAGPGGGM